MLPTAVTTVRLPTSSEDGIAYWYTFEGDVEDVSGQHIANRAALVVHPASFYLAISRLPMFVDTKTAATAGVAAVDLSGRTVTDVPVTVSLVREEWVLRSSDESLERTALGAPRDPGGGVDGPHGRRRDGGADCPSRGGQLHPARDRARRERPAGADRARVLLARAGRVVVAQGGQPDRPEPERETWKPGETARILVHSPWPSATGSSPSSAKGSAAIEP